MSDWSQVVVLVATPLLAFAGALVGHWAHRRSAGELDKWRHREETMRMLRWAVDKALDERDHVASAGLTTLSALMTAELLQPEDHSLVFEIAEAVAYGRVDEYPEEAEIVVVPTGLDGGADHG